MYNWSAQQHLLNLKTVGEDIRIVGLVWLSLLAGNFCKYPICNTRSENDYIALSFKFTLYRIGCLITKTEYKIQNNEKPYCSNLSILSCIDQSIKIKLEFKHFLELFFSERNINGNLLLKLPWNLNFFIIKRCYCST